MTMDMDAFVYIFALEEISFSYIRITLFFQIDLIRYVHFACKLICILIKCSILSIKIIDYQWEYQSPI